MGKDGRGRGSEETVHLVEHDTDVKRNGGEGATGGKGWGNGTCKNARTHVVHAYTAHGEGKIFFFL